MFVTSQLNQSNPYILGNIVVWADNRDGGMSSHIYYYDLGKGNKRLSGNNSYQYNASISGNIIVWTDNRDGTVHVYYKNIETCKGGRVSQYSPGQDYSSIG